MTHYLARRYSDVYTCSKVQNCVVTLKTRKNCQFCRFRLCEKAGMKRSWVLADSDCKTAKVGFIYLHHWICQLSNNASSF